MDLFARRHWIFDLDGTLTRAVHDFEAIRRELGIPSRQPILEAIAARPPDEAARMHVRLDAWEEEMASHAVPEPDAVALVERLAADGHALAILTRNSRRVCALTLQVAGLSQHFDPAWCLGREDAAPKPLPDGVNLLLSRWAASPDDAVMVGDWLHDVRAGRGAGVATVLVDRTGRASEHLDEADLVVTSLRDLL